MILLGPIIGNIIDERISILYQLDRSDTVTISIVYPSGETHSHDEIITSHHAIHTTLGSIHNTGTYRICISTSDDTKYGSFTCGDRIIVLSCNNGGFGNTLLWDNIARDIPNVCIHIGDNIYMDYMNKHYDNALSEDSYRNKLSIFRDAYLNHWSKPHIANILNSCLNIFHWDDHDIHDSWDQIMRFPSNWRDILRSSGWEGIAHILNNNIYSTYIAAIEVYCEYQLPLNGMSLDYPCSYSFNLFNKRIAMIDVRMHNAGSTSLIPIVESMDMIICGVPIAFMSNRVINRYTNILCKYLLNIGDLYDQWNLYPDRIDSIISLCKEGTVILSGDVHMNGYTTIEVNNDIMIHQVTSSAISSPSSPWIISQLLNYNYQMDTDNNSLRIRHKYWSRENGYCILDMNDLSRQPIQIINSILN